MNSHDHRGLARLATLALVAALSSGCSFKPKPHESGFLRDYDKLERQPDGALLYRAPGSDLGQFDKVLLEPVELFAGPDSIFSDLEDHQLELLQKSFYNALYGALEPDYPVVEAPGPRVLRVRIAITGAERSKKRPVITELSDTYFLLRQLDMEAEFLDSRSGELVAAFVDVNARTAEVDGFGQADEVFGDWARRLRNRMDAEHGR